MLIKLQADVADLKTGLAQAENAIKGVDKSVQTASTGMSNFVTKLKQIGATMGIAFAGSQVLQFGRDVIQQAMEAEAQQQRLTQLMKVTVGATDEQIASLNAQADALEKVGVVTGGNITQTQSQLATFNLQTDTIKKLTPAILDYVTSEKGANASTDEFKQMTNGLAQALNGNFGSLTRVGFVLDDHTKKLISSGTEAERAAAIVDVLDSTYKGFNASLRDTPAGQMQALKNDFDKLKEQLGKSLLPALLAVSDLLTKVIIPAFRSFGKFLADNAGAIKTYIIIVGGLTTAFYAYKAALVVTKVAQEAYVVWQTIAKGATLASIASTNGLAASMLALNAAMRANPFGLILTAVLLLGAAFVWLWKHSDTFRSVAIKAAQGVMYAFSGLIGAVGKLLGIIGKIPGMGWAKGLSKGAEDFANKINIAGKNLSDLNSKVKAGYGEGAFTYGSGGGTTPKPTGGGGGGGLSDAAKKKLEGYKKDVLGIYKDMNSVIADAQEKAQKELEDRNDKMLKAHKNYDEKVADLNKRFNEANDAADKRFADTKAELEKRRDKAEAEARKRHKEVLANIEKDFSDKSIELEKNLNAKLDDIRKNAAAKSADLSQAAAKKQIGIIQQSMDMLRNAFASKTGFDLGEVFKGGADSAEKLLADLKTKLGAAKELQANAAKLAGMGYSQVFIQEVVKQGPEAGNKIAEALKAASPDATKELQALYGQVENVSAHGLDALAQTMNAGGKLATEELMKAYSQVSIDLKESLSEVNVAMNDALAEANANYADAMAQAKKDRDEKMADAEKNLIEALASAKTDFDEALADATKTLAEARAAAQKDLNEGLADAQKTLQEALLAAQADYEKAIDEINKSTMKKLEELKAKLAEVAALIASISAASAAGVVNKAPAYTPIIPTPSPSDNAALNPTTTTTVNITGVNLDDPNNTASSVINAIKFGNVIVPVAPSKLAAGESGAIGAASIKARSYVLDNAKGRVGR